MTDHPNSNLPENEDNGEELMDIFTLTDEEGNETQFELLGELDLDGQHYLGMIPLDGEDEGDEYVIFRSAGSQDGQEILETIEDDEEFERVADAFEDRFLSELDLDEQD